MDLDFYERINGYKNIKDKAPSKLELLRTRVSGILQNIEYATLTGNIEWHFVSSGFYRANIRNNFSVEVFCSELGVELRIFLDGYSLQLSGFYLIANILSHIQRLFLRKGELIIRTESKVEEMVKVIEQEVEKLA